jgi:DNA-binding GntR family transcriptional regulator
MIVDAICNHDPELAEQLMRDHLSKAITQLKSNRTRKSRPQNK